MATEPLRLRILKALTAALQEITIANGYASDLGMNVFRGKEYFGDDQVVPMVAILESPDEDFQEPPPQFSGANSGTWRIFIQGWVEDDMENPTDPAHILMADVKKRLAIEARIAQKHNAFGMGGAVDRLTFSPGVVRPPDAISGKAYFWIVLHLMVIEDLTNPYSL